MNAKRFTTTWLSAALVSLVVFLILLFVWNWQIDQHFAPWITALILFGGILLVFPICWLGRRLLDRRPTIDTATRTNVFVHLALLLLLGLAIVEAVKVGRAWRVWEIPLPEFIGQALTAVTGLAALLSVVNPALRGLGAPFTLALSRRLAIDWLYAWTRNPMVLATLACLVSLGLWYRSALLVLWALLLVTPAWLFFVKVYEERELEIRFGPSYLEYKARTSFLWPRKPAGG